MVPRAVLMKSGLVSLNTARQVNTAQPKITMNGTEYSLNDKNKAKPDKTESGIGKSA
ncbi:hypothetical protein Tco_1549827, partial [Tanacetum coccineum]